MPISPPSRRGLLAEVSGPDTPQAAKRKLPLSTPVLKPVPDTRLRDLRRMRFLATALLGLMFVIFIATSFAPVQWPWLSYLQAFAEAGMIGACADWFAVVAHVPPSARPADTAHRDRAAQQGPHRRRARPFRLQQLSVPAGAQGKAPGDRYRRMDRPLAVGAREHKAHRAARCNGTAADAAGIAARSARRISDPRHTPRHRSRPGSAARVGIAVAVLGARRDPGAGRKGHLDRGRRTCRQSRRHQGIGDARNPRVSSRNGSTASSPTRS